MSAALAHAAPYSASGADAALSATPDLQAPFALEPRRKGRGRQRSVSVLPQAPPITAPHAAAETDADIDLPALIPVVSLPRSTRGAATAPDAAGAHSATSDLLEPIAVESRKRCRGRQRSVSVLPQAPPITAPHAAAETDADIDLPALIPVVSLPQRGRGRAHSTAQMHSRVGSTNRWLTTRALLPVSLRTPSRMLPPAAPHCQRLWLLAPCQLVPPRLTQPWLSLIPSRTDFGTAQGGARCT